MNASFKAMLLAAAGSGLMSGVSAPLQAAAPAPLAPSGAFSLKGQDTLPAGFRAESMPTEKHACKGQNSCKGQGGCKTGDMGCRGKNTCKGKGGCNTMGAM